MANFVSKCQKKEKDCSDSFTEYDLFGQNVFDASPPALHTYHGTDLNVLSGRTTVLDDDSCQTIPLFILNPEVFVPGQIMPFVFHDPSAMEMMLQIINTNRIFGLINLSWCDRTERNVLAGIGTIAEVRSFRAEELGRGDLLIKAEGRQRFEVIESQRQSQFTMIGKVRILPELCLSNLGEGSKLDSLDKFKSESSVSTLPSSKSLHSCPLLHRIPFRQNKYDFAHYTPFPAFVYKMYDPQVIMTKIRNLLECWNRSLRGVLPSNPTEFSYWVAANILLDEYHRLELIKINECTARLRRELQILEACSVFSCRYCLKGIAKREDIFFMTLEGIPMATYGFDCNHATTVSHASGLQTIGSPSTEGSCYPGYACTIVKCEQCHFQMGWKFTALNKSLKPSEFYGLTIGSFFNKGYSTMVLRPLDAPHPLELYY